MDGTHFVHFCRWYDHQAPRDEYDPIPVSYTANGCGIPYIDTRSLCLGYRLCRGTIIGFRGKLIARTKLRNMVFLKLS